MENGVGNCDHSCIFIVLFEQIKCMYACIMYVYVLNLVNFDVQMAKTFDP